MTEFNRNFIAAVNRKTQKTPPDNEAGWQISS